MNSHGQGKISLYTLMQERQAVNRAVVQTVARCLKNDIAVDSESGGWLGLINIRKHPVRIAACIGKVRGIQRVGSGNPFLAVKIPIAVRIGIGRIGAEGVFVGIAQAVVIDVALRVDALSGSKPY